MPETENQEGVRIAPPEDMISIPLYLGGLIVTLCGIQTVNAAVDRPGFSATILLLTLIGFAFSFGCRWLKIRPRVIEILCLAFIAYIVYGVVSRQIDQNLLMPADRNDMRLAVILAWVAVLRSWTLVSDDHVMFSCVLTMAMIGLVATANPYATANVFYFCVFVLASIFLLIHQNYLQNRAFASVRERAREAGRVVWTQAALAGLCGVVVLVLGSIAIVPAQAVFSQLSLSQQIRRLVGTGKTAEQENSPAVTTRVSDDATFDIGTGDGWSASTEVVLHVSPSDGQEHYWRGRTYDHYTGAGWTSSLDEETHMLPEAVGLESGHDRVYLVPRALTPGDREAIGGNTQSGAATVSATFEVKGEISQYYYATSLRDLAVPRLSIVDYGPTDLVRGCADGSFDLREGLSIRGQYAIAFVPTIDPALPGAQARLRRAGTNYPREVRARYLGNMDGDPITDEDRAYYTEAVGEALRSLPPGRRDPFDETLAIQNWVSSRCIYSLTVDPIPPTEDHVRTFLKETQRGYCDMFASSMAVLCRTAGIPSRVVTGFAPGERDATGFNLRALDKHAWVEVYFPHYGWLPFDPTVGTRTDGTVPTPRNASGINWQRVWHALTAQGPIPLALMGLIAIILAYLFKVEVLDRLLALWRARRGPARHAKLRESLRTDIGRQYARMTRAIGRLGLPRRPSETPTEYADRAVSFLAAQERALGISLAPATVPAVTVAFVHARYGGGGAESGAVGSPGQAQPSALTPFLAAVTRAHWILLWRRLWRRWSPGPP